jgi:hypothetical protein
MDNRTMSFNFFSGKGGRQTTFSQQEVFFILRQLIAPASMILLMASSSLFASTIITRLQGAGHANV